MEIRKQRCYAANRMLTPTVKFDIFITISHLFVSQPSLQFTTFEGVLNRCSQQRKCTIMGNNQVQKMEHDNFEQDTSSKKAVQL